MSNVLLIKGESQYDAMRYYIEEIEMGFRLLGFHTIVLDGVEESFHFQITEVLETMQIDYVFTCNAIGADYEKLRDIVYVTYLCDHPEVHRDRLRQLEKRKAIIFTCDAQHEAYIRKYYPGLTCVKFIPMSGSYSQKQIPYSERSRDVIFTGSYVKQTGEQIREQTFSKFVIDDLIEHPGQSLEECLKHVLQVLRTEATEEEFQELVFESLWVSAYIRNYFRDKMIRSLVENDIKVHVYGNGWENFESAKKENLIIEKGNSYVARKAVADAKISLNIMPWFKAGFQERIASAMLSGTVSVTDESLYVNQNFRDGEELVVYSLERLEELPGKIKYLLEHPGEAEQIAMNGKTRADSELTWQHRAFEMADYMVRCYGNAPAAGSGAYGEVLQIPWRKNRLHLIGKDVLHSLDGLVELLKDIQTYDRVDLCDMQYLFTNFIFLFLRANANYPELRVNEYCYRQLMNLSEDNLAEGIELFVLQCGGLQSVFLQEELTQVKGEKERVEADCRREQERHGQNVKIIAEAGVNHNGSAALARRMVDAAKEAGADYIKFQTFVPEKLVSKYAGKADYQKETTGAEETQLQMLRKLALTEQEFCELKQYCEEVGIGFLSAPFDLESIDFLETLDMDFWKIPSGELTNLPYLEKIGKTGRKVMMSTGMCDMQEIRDAVAVLEESGTEDITLLHCNTEYPTPFEDVNLLAMRQMENELRRPVGYSDHTVGIEVPVAAAALGAVVIEKHFTLDKTMEGPDHRASLEPHELKRMTEAIRNIEKSLGDGVKKRTPSEEKNCAAARKSIVAKCPIQKGDIFTEENLTVKRPGTGISPMKWRELLGTAAQKDYETDELI